MRCPFCAHEDSQVKDSRPSEDGAAIRRRRQCEGCGARFTTFERVQLRDLTVLKKDNKREPFDRAKLERAIGHACRKRDIDAARIAQLVSGIQRQLETRGDEVSTDDIGQAVMDGLKSLDFAREERAGEGGGYNNLSRGFASGSAVPSPTASAMSAKSPASLKSL